MVPYVSLDDIRNKDERKLMIDFIYRTTISQTEKEVWGDFKVQRSCLSQRHAEDKPVLLYYNTLYCKFLSFIAN